MEHSTCTSRYARPACFVTVNEFQERKSIKISFALEITMNAFRLTFRFSRIFKKMIIYIFDSNATKQAAKTNQAKRPNFQPITDHSSISRRA